MTKHISRAFALARLTGALAFVLGLAACGVDQRGMVLLTDSSYRASVFSTSEDGFVLPDGIVWLPGVAEPESTVVDEEGNLYIADDRDQVVYMLTPQKKRRLLVDKREGFSPETVWYADDTLFITDSKNGKLSRFTPEDGLETIALFGGELRNIRGVATDDQGDIYVSIYADPRHGTGYIVKLERTTDAS